jgi:hypothetical protein
LLLRREAARHFCITLDERDAQDLADMEEGDAAELAGDDPAASCVCMCGARGPLPPARASPGQDPDCELMHPLEMPAHKPCLLLLQGLGGR